MKLRLRDHIWFNQTIYTLSLTLILGLLFAFATITLDLLDEQVSTRKHAEKMVYAMRHQAAQAVFNIDPLLAAKVANGLSEYELFQHVYIIDDLGTYLYKIERAPYQSYLSGLSELLFNCDTPIVVPLTYPGSKIEIGNIEVHLDHYLVADKFFQRAFRTIIGSLFQNMILSICLLILFYYTLTRPLMNLGCQVNEIDPNNPTKKLVVGNLHNKNELGVITSLLNQLLVRLKDVQNKHKRAEQELINQNDTLDFMVKERTVELRDMNNKLNLLATTDPLTGLYNRRFLFEIGTKRLHQMQRDQHSVAVMMCDIDHFKQVNDNFGHAMGDKVLQGVAECFSSIIRKDDILARYGGEEFVILLSEISPKDAQALGERLCRNLNDMVFTHADKSVKISVSIGLSVAPIHCNYDINALINTADMALYKAKELGRNRLEIAN